MNVTPPSQPVQPYRVREVTTRGASSWTVLGPDAAVCEPIEKYLSYLTDIERSPNTVRAYAFDLAAYFRFLCAANLRWQEVTTEDLGGFIAEMRSPAAGVAVATSAEAGRRRSTVNRMMAAIANFYEFHRRYGVTVNALMAASGRSGYGSYRPFLHGIAQTTPRGRVFRLSEPVKRAPRTLTPDQLAAIIEAQPNLRNKLFFTVLMETGARLGQILGLRHEDVFSFERRLELVSRSDNANGARGKGGTGSVFVTHSCVRLYADYMHREYGDLDSDYVFVNLWGGRVGSPMSAHSVYDIVKRTSKKVGFHFSPHMFRHSFVSRALAEGVPLEVVSKLVTHRSSATTSEIYAHLGNEELRLQLERAGLLDPPKRSK